MEDVNIILLFLISVMLIFIVYTLVTMKIYKTSSSSKLSGELINNNISIKTKEETENPQIPYNPYYAYYYPNNYYPWTPYGNYPWNFGGCDRHRGYTGHNGKIVIKM
jgi:hypothetical protein